MTPVRGTRRRPVGRLPGAGASLLRARRPGDGDRLRRRPARSRRSRRCPRSDGALGREGGLTAERPVLVDRFLEDAVEVDVDAVRDATGEVLICGVMEHVEEAGVHSGDSACALPPQTLDSEVLAEIERITRVIAEALDVRGLCNVQFAVKDRLVYVLEANPRASRTVPFVAKATGVPVAMVAARVIVGATLAELRTEGLLRPSGRAGTSRSRRRCCPFNRFPGGRHAARPGDALDRRGDGDRRHLRPRLREEPDGRRQPSAGGRDRVPLARRPRQAGRARGGAPVRRRSVSTWLPRRAQPGSSSPNGLEVSAVVAKVGHREKGVVDAVELIAGRQGADGREHPARPRAPCGRRSHPARPRSPIRFPA